jgi:hypothetical protein
LPLDEHEAEGEAIDVVMEGGYGDDVSQEL